MKYDFDKPVNRYKTYSMKWDAGSTFIEGCEESGKIPLPVFTADMDFVCAESIRKEMQKVVDRNNYGYTYITPAVEAFAPYYEAIQNWFKENYDWNIETESIVYVPGTLKAIEDAIRAFSEEGDGIIINPPVYGPFTSVITQTKRTIVRNPMMEEDGYYTFNYEELEELAKNPANKMLILCSPHNPVGRIWSKEELQKIYEICERNQIMIVSDEVHADITRQGKKFIPFGAVCDGKWLIACTAPNKSFNVADLNCTNVIISNPNVRKRYMEQIGFVRPNIFTVAAVLGAYCEEGKEWLEQVKVYIDDNIDWVLEFVKERMPQLKIHRPEGTYILWMDFRGYHLPADEVNERIIKKCGVMLERGEFFDEECGVGFQRICIPTRREMVREAFERMAEEFNS